jgi:hypothetical protein
MVIFGPISTIPEGEMPPEKPSNTGFGKVVKARPQAREKFGEGVAFRGS